MNTVAAAGKAERLEARITSAQKEILQRAAEIEGRSLTDFVVSSAQAAARRILHEHRSLQLSERERELFVDAILNPPAPNAKLRKAARQYRQKRG
jgi:uncharacterized protein (DUF1778 family)